MNHFLQTLNKNRFLFSELVKRDFKQKYKRTVLGMDWSVLSPLLNLLVMSLVFTQFFGRNTPHYTIYLFCGNLVFSYYRESTNGGMNALMANAHIFTKVNVPKYLFLLSKNVSSLINFGLNLCVFFSHLPTSFLKSTFSKVWEQEYEELNQTCLHRFRSSSDVNQWIMEYWQMAENCFFPRSPNVGRYYEGMSSFYEMCDAIRSQKYAMICFNDSLDLDNFEEYQAEVRKAFQSILPIKSKFEKCEDLIDA